MLAPQNRCFEDQARNQSWWVGVCFGVHVVVVFNEQKIILRSITLVRIIFLTAARSSTTGITYGTVRQRSSSRTRYIHATTLFYFCPLPHVCWRVKHTYVRRWGMGLDCRVGGARCHPNPKPTTAR